MLRRMRGAGITIPVIFLTVLSDDIYEQAALEGGAADFIDKARRLPILLKRLQLIAQGGRSASDTEPVPAPYRVPGVDDEVEHRRLELRRIDLRRGKDRAQHRCHLDLLPDNPMPQAFDINNQLVQINGVGTGDLLTGIGKELADEVLSPLRRSHGALRQAFDFLGVAPRPQDQIEIAEDRRSGDC